MYYKQYSILVDGKHGLLVETLQGSYINPTLKKLGSSTFYNA